MTRRQPEKAIQQQIVTLLRSIGATVYVLGTKRKKGDFQGTMQTPGLPDLWVFLPAYPGRTSAKAVWVEVKAPGGRMTGEQEAFEDCCHECGVDHIVGNLQNVFDYLILGGWLKAENVPHYRQSTGATT